MISIQGVVHVQDNNSPGIWFEIGYAWSKAVPAMPFDQVEQVRARLGTSGVLVDEETKRAVLASITSKSKSDRVVVKAFIDRVRATHFDSLEVIP